MWTLFILLLIVSTAFMIEEFILIKPISTIGQSDPTCRRLEIASLWLPACTLRRAPTLMQGQECFSSTSPTISALR